jgi:hypothetical protein
MRLRNDEIVMRDVGGKTMVLDLASSTYFAIGGVGTVILKELREHEVDEQELIDRLLERFAVDRERLEADVAAFLERLERAGLLLR